MSDFAESIKNYPSLADFIVAQFKRPIEDVAGIQVWQDHDSCIDDDGSRQYWITEKTLIVTFTDETTGCASIAGMQFERVEDSE